MAEAVPIDLTSRVIEAATRAIRNERPSLRRNPSEIRSVVVEVAINGHGVVFETDAYIQRRLGSNEMVGLHGSRRP